MSRIIRILLMLPLITLLIATSASAEWAPPGNGMVVVLTDEHGKVLRGFSGDYEVQVQVDVATPSGIKPLGHYRIKRSGFWKFDTTGSVLTVKGLRKVLPRITEEKRYGVRFSVWIVDRENGVLHRGIGSTFLSAADLGGVSKRVKVAIFEEEPLPKPAREGGYYYEWRPADDSWEASRYLKVPLLIIDNRDGKGKLQGSISLDGEYRTQFSATLAYGTDLEAKFGNGDPVKALSSAVTIYGKRWVPMEGKYYFYRAVDVPKGDVGYVYLWARPYYRHEKEYICAEGMGAYGCSETGKERIDVGIYDVKAEKGANGYIIDGGTALGSPSFGQAFFSFTREYIRYPLRSNEGVSMRYLFSGMGGSCGVRFGVGVPVGAIAVAFGAPAPVAGLVASVQYEKAGSVSIGGGIQNYEQPITLRAFKSPQRYRFKTGWFSSCSVGVPFGLYVRGG